MLASAITGCVSIFAFASLIGIPIEITSPKIDLKTCSTPVEIAKHQLIIKRKEKKHDK